LPIRVRLELSLLCVLGAYVVASLNRWIGAPVHALNAVSAMAGTLHAESEGPGCGATLHLVWPMTDVRDAVDVGYNDD